MKPVDTSIPSRIHMVERRQWLTLAAILLLIFVIPIMLLVRLVNLSLLRREYLDELSYHVAIAYQSHMTVTADNEGAATAVWGDNLGRLGYGLSQKADLKLPRPQQPPRDLGSQHLLTLEFPTGARYTIYPFDYGEAGNPETAKQTYIHYLYNETDIWMRTDTAFTMYALLQASSTKGHAHANVPLESRPAQPLSEAQLAPPLPEVENTS